MLADTFSRDALAAATLVSAIGSAVAAIVAALRSGRAADRAAKIHDEIQTGSGKTIGEAVRDNGGG